MTQKRHKSVLGRNQRLEIIYRLLDPRDFYTHYVGRTVCMTSRLSQHCMDVPIVTKPLEAWIFGLLEMGKRPRIQEIAKVYPGDRADVLEAYHIRDHIKRGFVLFNIHTPGLPKELKRSFTEEEMYALKTGKRIHLGAPFK